MKTVSHFCQNVSKYRLKNTYGCFNEKCKANDRNVSVTKMSRRKMTEMFQWKNASSSTPTGPSKPSQECDAWYQLFV